MPGQAWLDSGVNVTMNKITQTHSGVWVCGCLLLEGVSQALYPPMLPASGGDSCAACLSACGPLLKGAEPGVLGAAMSAGLPLFREDELRSVCAPGGPRERR